MASKIPMHQGRKKRYIFAATVAVPIILFALYSAAQSNPYRNSKIMNFDSYQDNTTPNTFAFTGGQQEKGTWVVKSDETAPSKPNILAKLSSNETGSEYQIGIVPEGSYSNFEASVKFKIISKEQQQAAGLIVRFQDVNHYFVLVADAMNHRFSLCRAQTDALVCTQDTAVDITDGQWHTIRAQVAAQGIAGFLDDMRLLQRNDEHYLSGGQIGLWTKGDSNVYFDDLKVVY
jgi:hypothetical protein